MAVDCLPASKVFCVPPAYSEVWEPGGIVIRVTPDGKPLPIKPEAIRQAGARLILEGTDVVYQQSLTSWPAKRIGETRIFYRRQCRRALNCRFEIAETRNLLLVSPWAQPLGIDIMGYDEAGFERAVRSIAYRTGDGKLVPLSRFRWDKPPSPSRATDCAPNSVLCGVHIPFVKLSVRAQ